jgi:hypothetical protein
MCLDLNRTRNMDALIALANTAKVGRIVVIPLSAISDAFLVPHGYPGDAVDLFKERVPDAAFAYKWRVNGPSLLVERIIPDGSRRWIEPHRAHLYWQMNGVYFPRKTG